MTRPLAMPALDAVQEPPRPPAFPRVSELAKATVVLAAAAALGMATARLRFQVVDWSVESRDLQTNLRKVENDAMELRRDVARLKSPARLAEIAEGRMGLAKLPPETVQRLPFAQQRVYAWREALEKADRLGGFQADADDFAEIAQSLAPVAEMIRRDSGANEPGPAAQPATGKEEKPNAQAARLADQANSAERADDAASFEPASEAPAEIIARRAD